MMKIRRGDRSHNENVLNTLGVSTKREENGSNRMAREKCSGSADKEYFSYDAEVSCNEEEVRFDDPEEQFRKEVFDEKNSMSKRRQCLNYVADSLNRLSLSEKQLDVVFEVAVLIWQYDISAVEVKKVNEARLEDYCSPRSYRQCSACCSALSNTNSKCGNSDCSLYSLKSVRGAASQHDVVQCFSIRNQLEKICQSSITTLISTHQHHHRNPVAVNYTSFHLSKRYRENIESDSQFNDQCLTLPLSLSFDGFVPKNTSKIEITPLYLRVEGVERKEKEREESLILAAIHTGPFGVNTKNSALFVNRLRNELEEIKMRPLKVQYGSLEWKIDFKVVMMIVDLKAARLMYGYPNWNALEGCPDCCIVGSRSGTSAVSYYSRVNVRRRTKEEFKNLVKNINRQNDMYTLVTPLDMPLDELHTIAEGVTKRIYFDVLGKSAYFSEFKLAPKIVKMLDTTISNARRGLSQRSQFVMFSKPGRLSGAQLKQTSRVVFSLIGLTEVIQDFYSRLFLIGMVRYTDISMTAEDDKDLEKLKTIGDFLKTYIGTRHPSKFSFKCHMLFDHLVDKIGEFGNLSGTTSAYFEKCHRMISVNYCQYSSSPDQMGTKFLLQQGFRDDKKLVGNKFPIGFHVQVAPNWELKNHSTCQKFFSMSGLKSMPVFWKRMEIRGKVYTSESWSRRTGESHENVLAFQYGSCICFGRAKIFFSDAVDCFCILQLFKTVDPFIEFREEAHQLNVRSQVLEFLDRMLNDNNWIKEQVGTEETVIVRAEHIMKEMLLLNFRGRKFLLEMHN